MRSCPQFLCIPGLDPCSKTAQAPLCSWHGECPAAGSLCFRQCPLGVANCSREEQIAGRLKDAALQLQPKSYVKLNFRTLYIVRSGFLPQLCTDPALAAHIPLCRQLWGGHATLRSRWEMLYSRVQAWQTLSTLLKDPCRRSKKSKLLLQ
jgi:hypothetical protein